MELIYFGNCKGQTAVMGTKQRFKCRLKGLMFGLKPAVPSECCPNISCVMAHAEVCTVHICVFKCGFASMHQQARANGVI